MIAFAIINSALHTVHIGGGLNKQSTSIFFHFYQQW